MSVPLSPLPPPRTPSPAWGGRCTESREPTSFFLSEGYHDLFSLIPAEFWGSHLDNGSSPLGKHLCVGLDYSCSRLVQFPEPGMKCLPRLFIEMAMAMDSPVRYACLPPSQGIYWGTAMTAGGTLLGLTGLVTLEMPLHLWGSVSHP